jgi:hypothetical protein
LDLIIAIFPDFWFNTTTMNDNITIEETITPDIAAEIEHREWERGNEERERWVALEAEHGQLFTPREWGEHCADLNDHLDWVGDAFQSATEWE